MYLVTDMLVAVLNTCSKEELEESDEESVVAPVSRPEMLERRKVIKNKILAVGRMARVFALLRYGIFLMDSRYIDLTNHA
jgi:serine/threonine-protein phosphatase 2B catalytic subunit